MTLNITHWQNGRPIEKMHGVDSKMLEESVRLFLTAIGDDITRDGLKETPKRVAKMYAETMNGYFLKPEDFVTEFDNDEGYDGAVILKGAELYSICEHHLQMFAGELAVAYKPKDKIVGLSKLVRIARVYAKRPQVQERLTQQISDALQQILDPEWVVVRYKAEHYCMKVRGVRIRDAFTTTIAGHGKWPQDIFHV